MLVHPFIVYRERVKAKAYPAFAKRSGGKIMQRRIAFPKQSLNPTSTTGINEALEKLESAVSIHGTTSRAKIEKGALCAWNRVVARKIY